MNGPHHQSAWTSRVFLRKPASPFAPGASETVREGYCARTPVRYEDGRWNDPAPQISWDVDLDHHHAKVVGFSMISASRNQSSEVRSIMRKTSAGNSLGFPFTSSEEGPETALALARYIR